MKHIIAFAAQDTFAGWPANNGLWQWGNELLVGCSTGPLVVQPGHNIGTPIASILLRSQDGGEHWTVETPQPFVGSGGDLARLETPLDSGHPDFALRVTGTGYHGNEDPRGAFYASFDRGKIWRGPYAFTGLETVPQLAGLEQSPRTDYLLEGPQHWLVFLSARDPQRWGSDQVFCARTVDGGQGFQFVAWVTPPDGPHRGVMPASVSCSANRLVSTVRRRSLSSDDCWIDAYRSDDEGQSWQFLSRVDDTGLENGNPPALARLANGRLCCVYGQRTRRQMLARFSDDAGSTWGDALVLRDGFHGLDADADFGYPRLAQRPDGKLVAIYYWASRELPQQHIAATIF